MWIEFFSLLILLFLHLCGGKKISLGIKWKPISRTLAKRSSKVLISSKINLSFEFAPESKVVFSTEKFFFDFILSFFRIFYLIHSKQQSIRNWRQILTLKALWEKYQAEPVWTVSTPILFMILRFWCSYFVHSISLFQFSSLENILFISISLIIFVSLSMTTDRRQIFSDSGCFPFCSRKRHKNPLVYLPRMIRTIF